MNLTVLIEQIDHQRFRAATGEPISLAAEGDSREEALERLRQLAEERLADAELVVVEMPGVERPNPWTSFAGIWKDRTDMDEFVEAIQEYRREIDELEAGH